MSWVLFYFLAAAHTVVAVMILVRGKTWTQRIVLIVLLASPASWYCRDYFSIKAEHAEMCEQEGGLRILATPEKSDQVRWVGPAFDELTAKATLEAKYPRAKRAEAMTDNRGQDGERLKYYVAYTATPHPILSLPISQHPGKDRALTYSHSRVDVLSPMYEVSVNDSPIPNGRKIQIVLMKEGRTYARHTEVAHWWKGLQYPDTLPTWRCPGPDSTSGRNQIRNLIFD